MYRERIIVKAKKWCMESNGEDGAVMEMVCAILASDDWIDPNTSPLEFAEILVELDFNNYLDDSKEDLMASIKNLKPKTMQTDRNMLSGKDVLDMEQLRHHFLCGYIGNGAECLLNHMNACYAQWINPPPKTNVYTPLCAIIQSSGTGKSRTACELANHGVYVVYASFASVLQHPYPPHSNVAKRMNIKDATKLHAQAYLILTTMLILAAYAVGIAPMYLMKILAVEEGWAALVNVFDNMFVFLTALKDGE